MPIWSKASRSSAEKKAEVSESQSHIEGSEELAKWLQGLKGVTGPDTLLRFTKTPEGSIDLTAAHPSGLAQLMAGRRTRLSTLIRERQEYGVAARAARNLRAKIFEIANERGVEVGFLSAGTAVWTSAVGGKPQRVSAPVMLAALALTVRPGQDDYEIQLLEQARINPALVRHLKSVHGIVFDVNAVTRMAYSTARFDPQPVLDRMRTLIHQIPGAEVEQNLLVSTFADLTQTLDDPWINPQNPVIQALADKANGRGNTPSDLDPDRFAPLDDRDPADEVLLLDADSEQQYVVDAVAAGESLVVSAAPGTGQTQTAINSISALIHNGKSVLVVGDRRASLDEVAQQFERLGLDSLLFQLNGQTSPQQLKTQLIKAIVRNEKSLKPQLDNLHSTLVEQRHALVDHVASLHNVRDRWGCSPYQAMQSLAQLTAIEPAPATTVRLKRSVLDSIRDREELATRLVRAAELGSFSKEATSSPWHGARLLTRKETEEARKLAESLATKLPALHDQMQAVAEHSEIRLGATVQEWGEQLKMLVAVRESLDKFTPDIFDRPVDDLISATAPSSWRREHNVEMPSMQRSRLRRVAKEYIRPGVHIADLHNSLLQVQQQRAVWAEFAVSQRHPAVPSGLAELNSNYRALDQGLAKLGLQLRGTAGGGRLATSPYPELLQRLADLAADGAALETLPERTLLTENMREHGLGELLDDLAAREVPASSVASELELAWWQSALEAMISGDDYLAMADGDSLRQLEAEFRLADKAHISSGAARLRWELAERWRNAVAAEPRQAELLRTLLKDGRVTLQSLTAQSPQLLPALSPVWTISPYLLSGTLPVSHSFDAVVILDADSTSLQAVLSAIGRGKQVIAFGDARTASPRTFSVAVERPATGEIASQKVQSAFAALSAVLPVWTLKTAYRSVDEDLTLQLSQNFYDGALKRLPDGHAVTGLDRALLVEYLPDGTGLPSAGQDGVESVIAEVNRVVDLVFEHARLRPRTSLAVVTVSLRHAARIGEAIRLQLPNHPLLADFFASSGESFRVVDLNRAQGMVRDHVIFSLGYGRTPHGRALHNFGPLSAEDGRNKFALAMTRARQSLHVLTCFRPEDLDVQRLSHGAVDFYELLDRELGGNYSMGTQSSRAAASEQALGEDPLVADLGERLRVRGARVWHHYDGAIDVVAAADPVHTIGRDDAEIPTPVAIESDGTQRYRSMSVRERSRLRPEHLERLGWRYLPLWTIEVFTDPSACADRIAGFLRLEHHDELANSADRPGFLDEALEPTNTAVNDDSGATSSLEKADHGSEATIEGEGSMRRVTVPATNSSAEPAETPAPTDTPASEGVTPSSVTPATGTVAAEPEGILPTKAAEDDPRAWGDREGNQDHDSWLKEQRPPHWG
ncbi:AAA family ATPase [Pseudarthrobacter sp. J1763]|uniref:AAA family ATPase n=1 Tax=Pseudarthrobacter sp. J1763 TaxID=3420445 RepID=UPI003D2E9AD5